MSALIRGMWGMGDNIYQRPFVRELAKQMTVFLDTPWPELYEDIANIRFIRGNRALRTQLKNIALQKSDRWVNAPPISARNIGYNMRNGSIIDDMAQAFGMPGFCPQLDLPPVVSNQFSFGQQPIALIRPVTVRTEWTNTARNPLPEYIEQCARALMETHHVILVADLAPRFETLVGILPPHHTAFIHGELAFEKLLALIAISDILVGGVGWIVPASIAAGKRAFIVLGGQGGHNRPEKLIAPHWNHRLTFATPENYCLCVNMRHNCPKQILNLSDTFTKFTEKV